MVQTSAKGMENVRSVNAEQGCSHTELRIVSDSNQFLAIFKAWRELFVCFMNKCWPIQASCFVGKCFMQFASFDAISHQSRLQNHVN